MNTPEIEVNEEFLLDALSRISWGTESGSPYPLATVADRVLATWNEVKRQKLGLEGRVWDLERAEPWHLPPDLPEPGVDVLVEVTDLAARRFPGVSVGRPCVVGDDHPDGWWLLFAGSIFTACHPRHIVAWRPLPPRRTS